jgi:NADPH:quinone reductase-like Zn-dependent oxidoreductase
MRAYAVAGFGKAPALQEIPVPTADDGYLIRVRYAGVNPLDYKLLQWLAENSKYPFVMGVDFAGVVERAPAGQQDFRVGDRVFGMARTHGAYADYTAIDRGTNTEPLALIPEGVGDELAAALPIPAITALGSLDLLGVSRGQRLVVMGATGGVGGYAVQMARSRGAHVIATVRGDPDEARRLGAEEVYDTAAGEVTAALRASHPDGVDAVLDLVNDSKAIGRDAEILKPGGSLVSTLFAADAGWFAQRKITAQNINSNTNSLSSSQRLREVGRLLADGTITARIGATFRLEDAGQMLEKLRHGELHGKTLIRL